MYFIQFGLNLSAQTYQRGLQFGFPDFLTPQAILGAFVLDFENMAPFHLDAKCGHLFLFNSLINKFSNG